MKKWRSRREGPQGEVLQEGGQTAWRQTLVGGVTGIKDLIAPDGFKVHDNHIQVGSDRFTRVFAVTQVPRVVYVSFLESVYGMGDVDVSIHIYPVKEKDAVDQLTREITRLEAQKIIEEKRGDIYNLSILSRTVQDLWDLRDQIQMRVDALFYVTILIAISASSPEELEKKSRILEERMAGTGVEVRSLFLRQGEAFRSILPLGRNEINDVYRTLNLGAVISLFPFINPEFNHEESGVFLGANFHTDAPFFLDTFHGDSENYSLFILGVSGSGKSFCMKALMTRGAAYNIHSFILDYEGEYKNAVLSVGGAYIPLSPDRPALLNPLDIEADIDDESGKTFVNLREKVIQITDLFVIMAMGAEGMTVAPEERAWIEEAVFETYQMDFGITDDPSSLYEPFSTKEMNVGFRRKAMPTISDVYRRLRGKAGAERLALVLRKFLRGGTMGMFDGPSQIDLKGYKLINFNLEPLGESFLRPLAAHIVNTWAWENWIKPNRHVAKRYINDEAWISMKYESAADFLEMLARRGRKWGCSLCVASQRFSEFMNNEKGQAIVANANTRILMKPAAQDIDAVAEIFKLSDGERDFISLCGRGEALLKHGRESVAIRIIATPEEEELFSSKPAPREVGQESAVMAGEAMGERAEGIGQGL